MAEKKEEKKEADKAKVEPTADDGAAAKKKKKLMIIIIGAVVALAAGGGGAFFMLGKKGGGADPHAKDGKTEAPKDDGHGKPEAPKDDGHGKPEAPKDDGHGKPEAPKDDGHGKPDAGKKDEHGAAKPAEAKTLDIGFGKTMTLPPFHLNLGNPIDNRYVRIEIALEFSNKNSDVEDEIKARMPQLRDAVVSVTRKKSREFLLGPDGTDQLRLELKNRINQYMKKPIDNVYVTDILIE